MSDVPFTVDAFGEFAPGRVAFHWSDAPRPTTAELEASIARIWEEKLAEAGRRGAMLFNGRLVRWIDHRVIDGRFRVDVGPTDYRDFVGTNLWNRHRIAELGRHRFANPIGITATIISTDGWLLYGRRSHRVAYHAGYLHTFGGALEEADVQPGGRIDAFAAVRRELTEELLLGPEHIVELVCVGLIHDHEIWQPEMLFEARVSLTRDEVVRRLDHDDAHQEHTAIEACRDAPEAVVPFIRSSGPIAPVAVGAVCLHGRRRWGEPWFAAALRELGAS